VSISLCEARRRARDAAEAVDGLHGARQARRPRRRAAQAIELLSWPWRYEEREVLDDPAAEEARLRAREAAEAAAEAAAAAGAAPWDPNWEPGELDVRLVLLGAPDTQGLAAQPPSWARRGRTTNGVFCLLKANAIFCLLLVWAVLAWSRMESAVEPCADGRHEACIAGPLPAGCGMLYRRRWDASRACLSNGMTVCLLRCPLKTLRNV